MTAQDSLFLSTGQPQKKLEIAIVRLLEENEDPGGRYSTYLKKRLRPALLWIIGHGSPQMLGRLLDLFHPDSALLLEAATLAGRLGKTAVQPPDSPFARYSRKRSAQTERISIIRPAF